MARIKRAKGKHVVVALACLALLWMLIAAGCGGGGKITISRSELEEVAEFF